MNQSNPTPAAKPYSPGLEGIIAGESAVCAVDPNAGLLYRGYDVEDLAGKATFEEIAYLLLHDDLPSKQQYDSIRRQLQADQALPPPVIAMLRLLPKNTHPIDALRTGVSMLAPFDPDLNDHSHDANVRKSIRLIARVGTLVTSGYRLMRNEEPLAVDDPDYASRFVRAFTGKAPQAWQTDALNLILTLYAEHEFNASTFAARVTASTMADIYAAVTSALGTLKGPLHGGANEEAMKMLRDIGAAKNAEAWVTQRLASKEKIMGFGHRVYKKGDSRVPAMRELARSLGARFAQPQYVEICEALEDVMNRQKKLCANLDLYAAPALHLLGLPPELNVPVFAASRVAGWCAHVIEQHDHNRIIRPRCIYTGPPQRPYHPPQ